MSVDEVVDDDDSDEGADVVDDDFDSEEDVDDGVRFPSCG